MKSCFILTTRNEEESKIQRDKTGILSVKIMAGKLVKIVISGTHFVEGLRKVALTVGVQ